MLYTKNEVLQYVAEEDVKFIRLAFCDVKGCQKNISIMPGELERAFDTGIGIDASAIEGFGGNIHSDLFLIPDPSTLVVLPWRPDHGRVVRMFCEIMKPDGSHFELDSRLILKNTVKRAITDGLSFSLGSELEFYLFKTDDEGKRTFEPYDNAGYMDIAPMDKGENVRREICLTLERMGIYPESSHHEEGPGQNEIDFKFSDPVTAADNAITFLSVVKTIAARSGLYADFSPKPLKNRPGNSFHINISVENLLVDGDISSFAIAGILNRISDMTVFLNTLDLSYERLGKFKAPKFITWSKENRSQLIRIPAASGKYRRFELRSPDPLANPYLAYTLIISAAMEGIKAKEELSPETNLNIFTLSEQEQKKYKKIPESKAAAADAAEDSDFIKKILPEAIIKYYCD